MKDAADELGLTVGHLRHLCRDGFGPRAHRVGRRLLKISREDLDAYIQSVALRPAA
jgi:excisionase family DNA binding protein